MLFHEGKRDREENNFRGGRLYGFFETFQKFIWVFEALFPFLKLIKSTPARTKKSHIIDPPDNFLGMISKIIQAELDFYKINLYLIRFNYYFREFLLSN